MPITTGLARLIFLPAQSNVNGDKVGVKLKVYKVCKVHKVIKLLPNTLTHTSSIQHPASSIQHPASSIQHLIPDG
ncbi:MAG: hypothetical protein ABSE72_00515 [Bacteroidales bacterium]